MHCLRFQKIELTNLGSISGNVFLAQALAQSYAEVFPKLPEPHLRATVRTYGSGSFKQRSWTNKDGTKQTKWTGYVYASDDQKCYGTGNTQRSAEKDAQAKRDKYERALAARNAPVEPPVEESAPMPTLSEWTERFNSLKAINNRLKSNEKYKEFRRKVCNHMLPSKTWLGDLPLDKITLGDLEHYQATIRKTYAPNSAYAIVAYVRAALQSAVDHELIARNRAVPLQKIKRATKHTLSLDDDGFALLMRHADDRMRAGLILGYFGLRASEAMGLTLDCIEGNCVKVKQQLARIQNVNADSGDKTVVALTPWSAPLG